VALWVGPGTEGYFANLKDYAVTGRVLLQVSGALTAPPTRITLTPKGRVGCHGELKARASDHPPLADLSVVIRANGIIHNNVQGSGCGVAATDEVHVCLSTRRSPSNSFGKIRKWR